MVNFVRLSLVALIFSSAVSFASDKEAVNATIVYGLDTNPHHLSNELTPVDQEYAEGDFKFRAKFFDALHVAAKANKTIYFDDARADEFNASASIALRSKFKLFKKRFRYKLGANYRAKDKTYVSKVTGLVATFGGQSIADRYDSTQNNYVAALSFKPYRSLKVEFEYEGRDKAYEEFEIPGLSNLDYAHQEYLFGIEYKASRVGKFFLNGAYRQREFVDKRTKDLEGDDIADTDLIYDYFTTNIGYIYKPDKKTRWKYAYNYESRRDNGSGYYDGTGGYISMSASYELGDYHFIKGRLKYSKFSFENQLDEGDTPLDEDAKEKQGGSIMVGYEWVMATLFDNNLALYVELEHSTFSNTNLIYSYEQSKASAGFRWSVF